MCIRDRHGVIPLLYGGLAKLGWVSPVMLDWVLDINWSVFLFNVLPLYPLDGGRIEMCIRDRSWTSP